MQWWLVGPTRTSALGFVVLFGALSLGCPASEEPEPGALDITAPEVAQQEDVAVIDTAAPLPDEGKPDTTETPDTNPPDTGPPDVGPPANPCVPCETDDECDGGLTCQDVSDEGRYCLASCDDETPCGNGFACFEGLCLPETESCGCTEDNLGATIPCQSTNDVGTCTGVITCQDSGWSACDAAEPAPEACGGGDENCNGVVDEPDAAMCTVFYGDADSDDYGVGDGACLCVATEEFSAASAGDCNDLSPSVSPKEQESCNGIDDDCDGETDQGLGGSDCATEQGCEGVLVCSGEDGFLCQGPGIGVETCDGEDNDCDGVVDEPGAEGCTDYFEDKDADEYGQGTPECVCGPTAAYTAQVAGDCNDVNKLINPGMVDECNGLDDDCDGAPDPNGAPGCQERWQDKDGDDAGDDLIGMVCVCDTAAPWTALVGGDCNDQDGNVYPGQEEICNGIDDNCVDEIDEGLGNVPCTGGIGICEGTLHCLGAEGLVCDAATAAAEVCGDGVDNDCDGLADEENAGDCTIFYEDKDNDGAGNSLASKCLCAADGDFTATVGGDCDDDNEFAKPGMPELCNEFDDDCDGAVNEDDAAGCTLVYADKDGDGIGLADDARCMCVPTYPYTSEIAGDCNDDNVLSTPGKIEICNAVDDDCDGQTDEGLAGADCSADNELGSCSGIELCTGSQGIVCSAGFALAESCNGIDDNCNGVADDVGADGCTPWYEDKDGDGVGSAVTVCLCGALGDFTTQETGDCDDDDPAKTPGKAESCNGFDDNCDGIIDVELSAGCDWYYFNNDGDDYGDSSLAKCLCAPDGKYDVLGFGDCNDNNPAIHPEAEEPCNNLDDDCDNAIDEEGNNGETCSNANALGSCDGPTTCLDGALYCLAPTPSAETCNGADDNCDGVIDEGVGGGACSTSNAFGTCSGVEICDELGAVYCPAPQASQEVCDAVDNNCDGATDEGLGSSSCGVGECAHTQGNCVGGVAVSCDAFEGSVDEVCDGLDNDCDGATDEDLGDITCGKGQCAHQIAACINGAPPACDANTGSGNEVCDTIDNDCDGLTDEGTGGGDCLTTNELGSCSGLESCIGGEQVCNAAAATVDVCDGIDNDCDGIPDPAGAEGCTVFYADNDGDGWGVETDSKCLCAPNFIYKATSAGDCHDGESLINPTAKEACDGLDNNCSAGIDEEGAIGCTQLYDDQDGDGFGGGVAQCWCVTPGPTWTDLGGDCNDGALNIYPGAVEVCDDALNDCEQGPATADLGCDTDGDGYCSWLLGTIGNPAVCPGGGNDCDPDNPNINPGVGEVCDGIDNDCFLGVDNGVAAPCGGCTDQCVISTGSGEGDTNGWDTEKGDSVGINDGGGVVIDVDATSLAILWTANTGNGTVSRINTETGQEEGRYIVGPSPSRTAVDSNGHCWVASRGTGHVTQIRGDPSDCTDSNGNGVIETSQDLNGNGVIDEATEMLGAEEDECRTWHLQPEAGNARALTVTSADEVWVGYWASRKLYAITPDNGDISAPITLSGGGRPYGMAAGAQGNLYVSMRAGGTSQLAVVPTLDENHDPLIGTPKYFNLVGGDSYGIAVDGNGVVWVAGGSQQTLFHFDPATEAVGKLTLPNLGNARGVTATLGGDIFIARHKWGGSCANDRWITRVNANTKTVTESYDLGPGRGPIGVTVGFGNKLWSLNQCSSTATQMDAATGEILMEVPTGPAPYTYSDMSGYQLKAFVSPDGVYKQVYEGWGTGVTTWKSISLVATTPPQTLIEVLVRSADSEAFLEQTPFQLIGDSDDGLQDLPINKTGRFLEVAVDMLSLVPNISPVLDKIDIVAEHAE